jgi:hypothetical protein
MNHLRRLNPPNRINFIEGHYYVIDTYSVAGDTRLIGKLINISDDNLYTFIDCIVIVENDFNESLRVTNPIIIPRRLIYGAAYDNKHGKFNDLIYILSKKYQIDADPEVVEMLNDIINTDIRETMIMYQMPPEPNDEYNNLTIMDPPATESDDDNYYGGGKKKRFRLRQTKKNKQR